MCDIYYDLPPTKTKRFTGMGLGSRGDFIKINSNPSPGAYNPSVALY